MKKYVVLLFLLVPTLFFMGWIATLNSHISAGEMVQVPLRGYDPRDLLTGHYIQYTIDPSFDKKAHPKCQLPKTWEGRRYYVPEESAEVLDKLFRQNTHQFSILFSCNAGTQAIARQLLIDNKEWHQFLKEM